MKISIGSDHAGFERRVELAERLKEAGHEVTLRGATGLDSYDYPKASDAVARDVLSNLSEFGVLLCGMGIGVSIRANRYLGIRAANCCTIEMAELARRHNHANVLCLGARLLNLDQAWAIVETFLGTPTDPDERHARRVAELGSPNLS